jgi:hypothetical protein
MGERIEDFEFCASKGVSDLIKTAKKKLKLLVPWPNGVKFKAEKKEGVVHYLAHLPSGQTLRSTVPFDQTKMDSSKGTYYVPEENAVYLEMLAGEQLLFQFDEPVEFVNDEWMLASEALKWHQENVKRLNLAIKEYKKPDLASEGDLG